MTKEGSNLRGLARRWSKNKSIKPGVYNCLMTIADRIDSEMVELPKDKDGEPIHVGETVYGEDGKEWHVLGIVIGENPIAWKDHNVYVENNTADKRCNLSPERLTHERPDSWERIADELKRYANDSYSEDEIDGMTASTLVDFADRIRKLAKKEGE